MNASYATHAGPPWMHCSIPQMRGRCVCVRVCLWVCVCVTREWLNFCVRSFVASTFGMPFAWFVQNARSPSSLVSLSPSNTTHKQLTHTHTHDIHQHVLTHTHNSRLSKATWSRWARRSSTWTTSHARFVRQNSRTPNTTREKGSRTVRNTSSCCMGEGSGAVMARTPCYVGRRIEEGCVCE